MMPSKTDANQEVQEMIIEQLSRPAKWWAKAVCYESGQTVFESMSAFMLKDGINGNHKKNGSAYLEASLEVLIEVLTKFYLVIFALILLLALPLSFWLGVMVGSGS